MKPIETLYGPGFKMLHHRNVDELLNHTWTYIHYREKIRVKGGRCCEFAAPPGQIRTGLPRCLPQQRDRGLASHTIVDLNKPGRLELPQCPLPRMAADARKLECDAGQLDSTAVLLPGFEQDSD